MDVWRALGLLAVGIAGSAGIALLARRLERDPVRDALVAWAKQAGMTMRGDGFEQPLEVVGMVENRWFTVSYDGNQRVMLVGLDCDAAHDEALVTRWTHPTIGHVGRLREVLEEMVAAAVTAESLTGESEPSE